MWAVCECLRIHKLAGVGAKVLWCPILKPVKPVPGIVFGDRMLCETPEQGAALSRCRKPRSVAVLCSRVPCEGWASRYCAAADDCLLYEARGTLCVYGNGSKKARRPSIADKVLLSDGACLETFGFGTRSYGTCFAPV